MAAHAHAQVGGTALIRAATQGHAECVRLLLDVGADKDAQDKVHFGSLFGCLAVLGVDAHLLVCRVLALIFTRLRRYVFL